MLYGNYFYILIENFPQKFSPCSQGNDIENLSSEFSPRMKLNKKKLNEFLVISKFVLVDLMRKAFACTSPQTRASSMLFTP